MFSCNCSLLFKSLYADSKLRNTLQVLLKLLLLEISYCESISREVVQKGQATGVPEREEPILLKGIVWQVKTTGLSPPLKMSTQVSCASFGLPNVCSECTFTLSTCDRPATVCKYCGNRCAVRMNGVAVGQ